MKKWILIIAIAITPASNAAIKKECIKYKEKLDDIQSELRAGYSEPRGNNLRKKAKEARKTLIDCKRGKLKKS